MPLVIAHMSDLHVSRYGEHVTSLRANLRSRQGRSEDWEDITEVDGWAIQRRQRWRWRLREDEDALELRLLDEQGYVQQRRKGQKGDELQLRKELGLIAHERHLTEHGRLARKLPSAARVAELLAEDPTNTNLRFLRAAYLLQQDAPDWVLVTGDVTDDGIGYDLVGAALAPFIDRGRLLAIPGNHDVYDSPPIVVPQHERKDVECKRALWAPFAASLGLPSEGSWVRELGEGAVIAALDSCTPAWTPLSASGEVPRSELEQLQHQLEGVEGRLRIAMLHHHVVNPPILSTGRAPWQLGMRLRNAKEVYDFFVEQRFHAVLNGHRHVGYRYHPAWSPLFLSAPSATLGCRTGADPYYWRLKVDDGELQTAREQTFVR
jgi:hypothetical protein